MLHRPPRPLTLAEARQWAADGGNMIVLVEGFLGNGLGLPLQQREHAQPPASSASEWLFHVSGEDIAEQVRAAGAQVVTAEPVNYAFISLRAA